MEAKAARERVFGALEEARRALAALQWHCDWRVAVETPDDPERARPDAAGWPSFSQWFHQGSDWKPGDAWFYATLTLPAEVEGVRLEGSAAAVHMGGWHPFQLYFEGELLAQEERPWLSTGPVLMPLDEPIQAGRKYQLALRVPIPEYGVVPPFGTSLRIESQALALEEVETILAELRVAESLAEDDADRAAFGKALAAIDVAALAARRWDLARASFEAAEEHLQPLSARAKEHTIHLMGHSHIDMNWMWCWDDTVRCIMRDFHSVAELMRDYPELTFTHSQVSTYEVVKERNPELFAEVRKRVAEGRWEVVASTWVEGDLNMANGESLARQFLYAIRWCRQHLGVTPKILWEPDTFGHPGNMPQLARLAGIERYFHMRCNRGLPGALGANAYETGPGWWPVYWWEGIDGSRVLVTSRVYNGDIGPMPLLDAFQTHRAQGSRTAFHIHGVGDHGGGPVRVNLETLRRLQQRPLMPTLKCSTMEEFGTAALREGIGLPVARGESDTVFEGCYTTHADIKRFNREGENLLLTAEALAALAGTDERVPMARAWQHVLFNQFHDLLDGSAITATYAESAALHEEVCSLAGTATEKALAALAAQVDASGEGEAILVANPLGWTRTDVVRVSGLAAIPDNPVLIAPDGTRTPGQRSGSDLFFVARDVPALGHVVYHLVPADAPGECVSAAEDGAYFRVETPVFSAAVAKASGILCSLVDKRCGRELNAHGMPKWGTYVGSARPELALNVLQIYDEEPHGMTAWQMNQVHTERSLISGATVTLAECGPVRAVLHVEHSVRSSRICQEMVFYRDLDRIDFETVADWQEIGTPQAGVPNLKVAFTARLDRPEASFEIPYGAVARASDGQEVPALRWADVSGDDYGISLLNDCKYGYDALGGRIRLTLIRCTYDPDRISDQGEHRFRYSLYPHAGTWREADTVRQGAGFNQPMPARAIAAAAGTRPAVEAGIAVTGAPSVILSGVKRPEEGEGVIVRLYESQGVAGSVALRRPGGVETAEVVNLIEETLSPAPVRAGAVELSFRPWEVKTLRVR